MQYKKDFIRINGDSVKVQFESPSECPICHRYIEPTFIAGHFEKNDIAAATFFCKGCERVFISRFEIVEFNEKNLRDKFYIVKLLESLPTVYEDIKFEKPINELCPDFSNIYNQSRHAENLGFSEICGMGYRKAIERLIKAYCSKLDADNRDVIYSESLGATINRLEDKEIRSLAFAIKEIGNDNTHSIQKYDYSIQEMKSFIEALIHFISYHLLALQAQNDFQ